VVRDRWLSKRSCTTGIGLGRCRYNKKGSCTTNGEGHERDWHSGSLKGVMAPGDLKQILEHVHGSMGSHHLKTRIKKIIFMVTNRRMIRSLMMIGTGIT
jgi:hypothetical protein